MVQNMAAANADAKRSSSSEAGWNVLMDKFRASLSGGNLPEFINQGGELVPAQLWLQKAFLWLFALGPAGLVLEFMASSPHRSLVYRARDADHYTALHRAVMSGDLEIVRLLSRIYSTSPSLGLHARTRNGWTALHIAVFAEDFDMVDLLMKWYDDSEHSPPRDWDFRDDMWMTPLQYGVLGRFSKVVGRLLDSKAFGHHVNSVDYFGRSAMHMACGHRASVLVEELLAKPVVDPNSVDCCGYTPLHWAVYGNAAEVVRSFTTKATERTIRMTEEDSQGRPVLQIAIEYLGIDHKVGKDIQKLLLTVPEVKNEVEGLYRDRQVFVDAANAILVGAALIASVTFGGWLQPPKGSNLDLQIFWAFNSLSFFFSLATVLAGAGTVLPMSDVYISNTVRSIRRWLALTSFLLLISVLLVLGAFAAAGYASLRPNPLLQGNMITTTSVGTVICGTTGLFFLNRLLKIKVLGDFMVLFGSLFRRMRSKGKRNTLEAATVLGVDLVPILEGDLKRQSGSDNANENVMESMKVFEEAFQAIRKGGVVDRFRMSTLTEITHYRLHLWREFPPEHYRRRALEKDMQSWAKAKTSVLENKKRKLDEEKTRSYTLDMSFEEWDSDMFLEKWKVLEDKKTQSYALDIFRRVEEALEDKKRRHILGP